MPKELFDILEGHPFDGEHCFLCGTVLNFDNRTEEHVFPRWLQNAFGLRNQTINLLNRTQIQYRNLVIPCCRECNGTHLSQLENRVKAVVLDDSKSLDEISDSDLNAWLSKIYVGIHWKELQLRLDRSAPSFEPILPKHAMESFRMVHFFMQSCRKRMTFSGLAGRFPNSLLRVDCKVLDDIQGQFDYLDNFMAHTVAIRMGCKGIVGIFDGGLHDLIFPDFAEMQFEKKPLHSIQFKEIFAKLTYKSSLSLCVPYFGIVQEQSTDSYNVSLMAFDDHNKNASCVIVGTDDGTAMMIPVLPKAAQSGNSYADWYQEDFARGLSKYTGIPFDQLFVPPDLVRTFLRDEAGSFLDIPLESPT